MVKLVHGVTRRAAGVQGTGSLRLLPTGVPCCQMLLDLCMQACVKLSLALRMPLLIKVMLVGRERLFAFPFHIRDEVGQSSLHAPRVVFAVS